MIFVDMDGVLTDFIGAVEKHFQVDIPPSTGHEIWDAMGYSEDTFWKRVNKIGPKFWATMDKLPWCDELLVWLQDKDWVICTKPSRHWSCAAGKVQWINNHIRHKWIMIQDKHLLSQGNNLLIDNHPDNCENWGRSMSVLFPDPYANGRRLREPVGTFLDREISYTEYQWL